MYQGEFNGEVVFEVTDTKPLSIDLGAEIKATKQVIKDDVIALGKKAPKYKWMYQLIFADEEEFLRNLEKLADQLYRQKAMLDQIKDIYEDVSISIYFRSEYSEIGYSIPGNILKKLSELDCTINVSVLSFGMTRKHS